MRLLLILYLKIHAQNVERYALVPAFFMGFLLLLFPVLALFEANETVLSVGLYGAATLAAVDALNRQVVNEYQLRTGLTQWWHQATCWSLSFSTTYGALLLVSQTSGARILTDSWLFGLIAYVIIRGLKRLYRHALSKN